MWTGDHHISIDGDTMMRQAKMTAHAYMLAAVRDIDENFGKGHATKHPDSDGHCDDVTVCADDEENTWTV
jgi:hypothetical protein